MALPTLPAAPTGLSDSAQTEYLAALQRVADSLDARNQATDWWGLAGAFLDPGRTGSFGEGLGRAGSLISQQERTRQEQAPNIAALKASIAAQKFEAQNQAEAMGMLASAVGANPIALAKDLQDGSVAPEVAGQLRQIDPKVYLAIATKSPKVGELVKGYAGMVNQAQTTDISQKQLLLAQNQALFGQQVKQLELQNAQFKLQLDLLSAGNDQAARARANAEFVDKVGAEQAAKLGIKIEPPAVLPQMVGGSAIPSVTIGGPARAAASAPVATPEAAVTPPPAVVASGTGVAPMLAAAGIVEPAPNLRFSKALVEEAQKNPDSTAARMLPKMLANPRGWTLDLRPNTYWDLGPDGNLIIKQLEMPAAPAPAAPAPAAPPAAPPAASVPVAAPSARVAPTDQAAKDAEAIPLLQVEKQKAEARLLAAQQAKDTAGATRAMGDIVALDRELKLRAQKAMVPVSSVAAAAPAPAPAVAAAPSGVGIPANVSGAQRRAMELENQKAAIQAQQDVNKSNLEVQAKEAEKRTTPYIAKHDLLAGYDSATVATNNTKFNELIQIVKANPKVVGLLTHQGPMYALAQAAESGITTPWGSLAAPVGEAVAKLQLNPQEQAVARNVMQLISDLNQSVMKQGKAIYGPQISTFDAQKMAEPGFKNTDPASFIMYLAAKNKITNIYMGKMAEAQTEYFEQNPRATTASFFKSKPYKQLVGEFAATYQDLVNKSPYK